MKIYTFASQGVSIKPFSVQPVAWTFKAGVSSTRFVAHVSSTRFVSSR